MPQNKNEKTEYLYYEKDEQQATHLSEVELNNYLKNESTSRDIIKKYEIFKRIVEKHKNDFEEIQESKNNFINLNSLDWSNRVFFIKKFLISKNCVLFRLSNKLIQIFFNDDTEMSFSTETTKFLYINQDGKEINRDIQDAMNGNDRDLTNKIKISKNMLIYFVKTHKSKKVPK